MAETSNPFLDEGEDFIENEVSQEMSPSPGRAVAKDREATPDSTPEEVVVTIDMVAARLLKDNFTLTALEFHTELVESGRDLPRLRDFFSNPTNFERTKRDDISPPGLPRTSSVQTFDSLDFARYSDDGDRQESDKVAVLEFELRKAQDTIKSLRATLTKAAETEVSSPDTPDEHLEDFQGDDPIRQYEKRAINFLVNEYLMIADYKLTSVTLAEENENQDFEDWDDVGLNIPKPPDLLHLYRDFGQHAIPISDMEDVSCQVNIETIEAVEATEGIDQAKKEMAARVDQLEDQIQILTAENDFLSHQLKQMERQAETAEILRLKHSTPAVSPINTPAKGQPQKGQTPHLAGISGITPLEGDGGLQDKSTANVTESADGNKDHMMGNQTGPNESNINSMQVEVGSGAVSQNITMNTTNNINKTPVLSNRNVSATFQKALLATAFQVSSDNRILSEVSQMTDSDGEKVVLMLARCLPHIVPNILLAKREELIPLILGAATLHPDASERDQLLNSLFNLIKRPDVEQRQVILTGCVAFAQHVGPGRVESEMLPQCWEQITHKYAERRLLVAEACGALSPYLPNEIRSSLVLSILQQMLQDEKTEEVRTAVVRSLGLLMGFIEDPDKFPQGAELLMTALGDPSEKVHQGVIQVFLPAFAMWALDMDVLETQLLQSFLSKMEALVKAAQSQLTTPGAPLPLDQPRFILILSTLQHLIPILFASVLSTGPYAQKVDSVEDLTNITLPSCVSGSSTELTDLGVVLGSVEHVARLHHLYEAYISEEWYDPWENLNWVAGDLIPQLLTIFNSLDVSSPQLVHSCTAFTLQLCRTFGRTFTVTKIKPKFQVVLRVPEEQRDSLVLNGLTPMTKLTATVYASGVLGAWCQQEQDSRALATFLQELLICLSVCQAPLDSLKAAYTELCADTGCHELLLGVLWEGVVHTSAHVRGAAATMFEMIVQGVNEALIATRVIPALVTLASDPEVEVRLATVAAFGTVMESVTDRTMLDKVYMQFQTFMDDPMYRDQHTLHLETIHTFARVGPNAEPKFRDECECCMCD